jgi:hypothetical protein
MFIDFEMKFYLTVFAALYKNLTGDSLGCFCPLFQVELEFLNSLWGL